MDPITILSGAYLDQIERLQEAGDLLAERLRKASTEPPRPAQYIPHADSRGACPNCSALKVWEDAKHGR